MFNKQNKENKIICWYKDYLDHHEITLTEPELNYIKNRLNKLNVTVSEDKRFKRGFWYNVERELKSNKRQEEKMRGSRTIA